jgi:hypothetical protein
MKGINTSREFDTSCELVILPTLHQKQIFQINQGVKDNLIWKFITNPTIPENDKV